MSKIIKALNSMVSNPEKITDVIQEDEGYFFLYDKKYVWGIYFDLENDTYEAYFYPGATETVGVVNSIRSEIYIDYINYESEILGARESHETFSELYRIVKEKLFGVDKVLDDIIGDDLF